MNTAAHVTHTERLANARRVVIKIGSALFVDQQTGAMNRAWLEGEKDGPQLYRHMLHPRIPRLAFAGFDPRVVASFTAKDVERLLADGYANLSTRRVAGSSHLSASSRE